MQIERIRYSPLSPRTPVARSVTPTRATDTPVGMLHVLSKGLRLVARSPFLLTISLYVVNCIVCGQVMHLMAVVSHDDADVFHPLRYIFLNKMCASFIYFAFVAIWSDAIGSAEQRMQFVASINTQVGVLTLGTQALVIIVSWQGPPACGCDGMS